MDNTVTISEAYQYMLDHPELVQKYERKCVQHEWPEKVFAMSPQWATWFARAIITDHWPSGESLISRDPAAHRGYRDYVENMSSIGMLNHTVGEHQMKLDREDAQVRLRNAQRALLFGIRGEISA